MKKLLLVIVAIAFVFISCETENETFENSTSDLTLTFEREFTNSTIGKNEGGSFQLLVSDVSIMNAAKSFVKKQELDIVPESFRIETINGKQYLRIYSMNDYVSTVELIIDVQRGLGTTGPTVCTSSSCASGGGCIPDGLNCTKCTELLKDCKTTTTTGGDNPR